MGAAQPRPVAAAQPQLPPVAAQPQAATQLAVIDPATDGRLVAARQLVARLDAWPRRAWSRVRKIDLHDSSEGGEATFYYLHSQVQKIRAVYFGETGRWQTDFYLLPGQPARPAFVRERAYRYNRPIYYNSAAMREAGDTEAFDAAKSTVTTTRSYFDHAQLLYQTESPANDSCRLAAYRRRAQDRLADELRQLLLEAASQ